jgi:hypothetical protein
LVDFTHPQGKLLVANYIASVQVPVKRSIEMHRLLLTVAQYPKNVCPERHEVYRYRNNERL